MTKPPRPYINAETQRKANLLIQELCLRPAHGQTAPTLAALIEYLVDKEYKALMRRKENENK